MSKRPVDGPIRVDEFLNPTSMLTPGLAGSMTMLITNALSAQFELTPSWTGLVVSFLCGTIVLASSVGLVKKFVYYVLNSLIIFSVAAGASGIAASATQLTSWNIGISPAYATGSSPVHQDVAAHRVSAADGIGTIDRTGRDLAIERWTVAQGQSEEEALQSTNGDAEGAAGAPPAVLESEPSEAMGEAAEAKAAALEEELAAAQRDLKATMEALATAEMETEAAIQEAEAAKMEAEASAQQLQAVREATQAIEEVSGGFFKSWF